MFDTASSDSSSSTGRRYDPSLPATILLLEDHHDEVVYMTYILTAAGFRVVRAYGGEDAIHKMKTQQIDLLLTDLGLPKISGIDVIAKAKADPAVQRIPVLVATGYTLDQLGNAALAAGADGFLGKPFTRDALIQEVKKHLPDADQLVFN